MCAPAHRRRLVDVIREHGAAGCEQLELFRGQKEDIARIRHAACRDEPLADRERDTTEAAVEQRLLQPCALAELDRPLRPAEHGGDDRAAAPTETAQHGGGFLDALQRLALEQLGW